MSHAARTPPQAADELLRELRSNANAENVEGMARFGIAREGTLGVPTPLIWKLAKEAVRSVRRDPDARFETSELLWASGVHEARVASAMVADPAVVTRVQMERWALDIDSWDVCDQLCMKLWWQVPFAWQVSTEWAGRDEGFVKRAGFVLMACFGWKRTDLAAEKYDPLLRLIERESCDERNEVKKGVNWALRQIGKRDPETNARAITCAEEILARHGECASARWIARDALRELRSEKVRGRLGISG